VKKSDVGFFGGLFIECQAFNVFFFFRWDMMEETNLIPKRSKKKN